MSFKKLNNITGWAVCFIACLVYILTAEATGSFWDTGEFIASAAKLQLPHPPGAPVFTLIGRFFIILIGGDNPAFAVNVMSSLASGFTILFLFWTITHFARKLIVGDLSEPNLQQSITILAAGIVGGLAYTFSDSFWFSAVEGEVYSLSSFFTALVFWSMLKWERADDAAANNVTEKNRADRWIIFIFFMMGLSIGVHLLNLLTIPALVMIYYFKRYPYSRWGAVIAFIIGCIITVVVQVPAIQWTVKLAGSFDRMFVNGMNLPFFSGFIFFYLLLAVLMWAGLRWAKKNNWSFLRLGLWCFAFLMIGYSAYVTTLIRSNANPSLDMNNVDNPMSLVYYLGREQYGDHPLFKGQHFAAQPIGMQEGKMRYAKGKDADGRDAYIELGREPEYEYSKEDIHFFPRVWSSEPRFTDFYAQWLNKGRYQDQRTGQIVYEAPTYGDHIEWFFTYQLGFMYWRYFMWNFAGKQNDIQGDGNRRDGNWISGIPILDDQRLGDQSKMPDSIKHSKANNKLFLLPFVLGMVGCVFHFLKDRKDWIISFLLFFFTGLAVVLYLNQPGNQPRERDYAYVGSFYAFCIWIGLSVVGFVRMAREREDKKTFYNVLIYSGAAAFLIFLLSNMHAMNGGAFISSLLSGAYVAGLAAVITYAIRAIAKANWRTATITAFAICMITPLVMAWQKWEDHDRSEKTLAPDLAKNYIQSVDSNAIVFTYGDNDTYPLWYAQEVEGVREDIRIINTSLLGIDWYVNQLRYKVNKSDPIDVIYTPQQIQGLGYIQFKPQGLQNEAYDLKDVMTNVVGKQVPISSFPVKRFKVPVDQAYARQYIAGAKDTVPLEIIIELPEGKNSLTLDQVTILNIIASTNWRRPIYFTGDDDQLGLAPYLRKEGLVYRLVPFKVADARQKQGHRDNIASILDKFKAGGADKNSGIYFDEENRRHLLSIRRSFAEGAIALAERGDKQAAIATLNKAESLISTKQLPYGMVSRYYQHNQIGSVYLEAAYRAGHTQLSEKIYQGLKADMLEQKEYFDYLKAEKPNFYEQFVQEATRNEELLGQIESMKTYFATPQPPVIENPKRDSADTIRRSP